jgi:hypothetical protein
MEMSPDLAELVQLSTIAFAFIIIPVGFVCVRPRSMRLHLHWNRGRR